MENMFSFEPGYIKKGFMCQTLDRKGANITTLNAFTAFYFFINYKIISPLLPSSGENPMDSYQESSAAMSVYYFKYQMCTSYSRQSLIHGGASAS